VLRLTVSRGTACVMFWGRPTARLRWGELGNFGFCVIPLRYGMKFQGMRLGISIPSSSFPSLTKWSPRTLERKVASRIKHYGLREDSPYRLAPIAKLQAPPDLSL
jgi:hypothetical protein